jgi:type IV secretion system protein VirD4
MELLFAIAFSFGGLLFGCRRIARNNLDRRWEDAQKIDFPKAYGDARFSTDEDARKGNLLTGRGLWLAISKTSGRVFLYGGDAHLTAIGATGIGKARDVLVAMVLSLGSKTLIANDPKGQLMCICSKARLKVGPVYALNPFGLHPGLVSGVVSVSFNPMGLLRADDPLLAIKCDKIADGLILDSGRSEESFWNDGAKGLLSGLEMALVELGKQNEKNLTFLTDVLNGDVCGFCRDAVSRSGNRYVKMRLGPYAAQNAAEDRTLAGFIQTARTHTKFICNDVIGSSLAGSGFNFKELREKPSTLFLVLPVDASEDVASHYYRLAATSALSEMLAEDCLGKTPVTLLLDESGQMGYMASILQAMSIARGYGVQLVNVFTDLSQMIRIYHEGAKSFLANSAVNIFFGGAPDTETNEQVSKLGGQVEMISHTRNISTDRLTNEPIVTDGAGQVGVPLIRSEDVQNLAPDELLIVARGTKGILLAKRRPYWRTHPGQFGQDPYEKKGRR